MTKSLYSKFILGYLLFGLLGFITIATFSSQATHLYLTEKTSTSMYDEANLLASTYSDIYQGKNVSLANAKPQLEAVATYLNAKAWVLDNRGTVIAETSPASHVDMTVEGFDPTATADKSYMIGNFFGMFKAESIFIEAPYLADFLTDTAISGLLSQHTKSVVLHYDSNDRSAANIIRKIQERVKKQSDKKTLILKETSINSVKFYFGNACAIYASYNAKRTVYGRHVYKLCARVSFNSDEIQQLWTQDMLD